MPQFFYIVEEKVRGRNILFICKDGVHDFKSGSYCHHEQFN